MGRTSLVIITDPFGIDAPCGATRHPIGIDKTPAAFVAYVRTLPGFTVATEQATVSGLPATHVTITPKGSAPCQTDGSIVAFAAIFHRPFGRICDLWRSGAFRCGSSTGRSETNLFLYGGDAVTPAEEASVISSLEFLDALPTP